MVDFSERLVEERLFGDSTAVQVDFGDPAVAFVEPEGAKNLFVGLSVVQPERDEVGKAVGGEKFG